MYALQIVIPYFVHLPNLSFRSKGVSMTRSQVYPPSRLTGHLRPRAIREQGELVGRNLDTAIGNCDYDIDS